MGGLAHIDWRSFDNDRKVQDSRGFIDGDLVERFCEVCQFDHCATVCVETIQLFITAPRLYRCHSRKWRKWWG